MKNLTQIVSKVPQGTAPLVVDSSTLVLNLNADKLDGLDASAFATAAQGTKADNALPATSNAVSATKLLNSRVLTIGNTGKGFDGTGALAWSLSEIGAAAASHAHAQTDVTGLGTALAGKSDTTHTHNYAGSASPGAAATSALKLNTARSIGLSGVTATSQNFDGSGNITIPITAVPTSLLTGTVDIAHGGTGAGVRADASYNLTYVGTNISFEDVPNNWPNGYGYWFFDTSDTHLTGKPSNWGILVSYKVSGDIAQTWFTQGANGPVFHRQGNSAGWANTWNQLYDSASVIPVANGGTGATDAAAARANLWAAGAEHSHAQADISGLSASFAEKIDASLVQPALNTLRGNLGDPTVMEMGVIDTQFTNKFRFFPPENIQYETSADNATWSAQVIADDVKKALVSERHGASWGIAKGTYHRLTFTPYTYVFLNLLYLYMSTNGASMRVRIEAWDNASGTWWDAVPFTNYSAGWPGHFVVRHQTLPFMSGTINLGKVRLTIHVDSTYMDIPYATFIGLDWFGGYPQGTREMYTWDDDKNVYFPAKVYASGNFMGVASSAAKLATPVNITLGGTAKLFDGSGPQGWTLAEIGAPPSYHRDAAGGYGLASDVYYSHAKASSTTPSTAGTASVGSETASFARGDHVHGAQTTISGNAGSATILANTRTFTIGSTGRSFNGSLDVSWTLADIGAVPLAGGTMTGNLVAVTNTSYTTGMVRNIVLQTGNPTVTTANNGWVYGLYT